MAPELPDNPPGWAGAYVGIPWVEYGRSKTGSDCWGLVRLVLLQRAGVELPSFSDAYDGTDLAHLDECVNAIRERLEGWVTVAERDPVEQRCDLSAMCQFDVMTLRIWGRPMHIGIVVARNWMLHSQQGCDSILERLTDRLWINRVEAVYRHASLA